MPLLRLRPPRHAGPVPRVLESVTTLLGPGEIRMCDAAGRKRRSRGAPRSAGLPGGVPPPPRPERPTGLSARRHRRRREAAKRAAEAVTPWRNRELAPPAWKTAAPP